MNNNTHTHTEREREGERERERESCSNRSMLDSVIHNGFLTHLIDYSSDRG